MVKKQGVVWNYYTKKENGTQVIAFCKFCDQSYIKNATRMERHMERCPKCPEDVRQQFIKVANNKKAKANIFNVKVNDVWPKQEIMSGSEGAARSDAGMDNMEHWEYPGQNSAAMMNPVPRQNVHYVMQSNSEWVPTQESMDPDHIDVEDMNDKEWNHCHEEPKEEDDEVNQLEDVDIEDEPKPERASPSVIQSQGSRGTMLHQRKPYAMRRITPAKSLRTSAISSSLQNKIYQEQLMERRALRRVAELELRRKTLEMERFQWEYQRDKAHSELRWAHETRMMQLREERERLAIEQSRARGPLTHVS